MEVISIDPKQVSMMVGTEVCRTLLQTMYKEAPSSLSARRTAMKDNEMVFGADGGGGATVARTRLRRLEPGRRRGDLPDSPRRRERGRGE